MRPLPSLLLLPMLLVLSACGEEQTAIREPQPRPVLTLTVTETAPVGLRTVPGIVRSRDRADLSFRVGGRVLDIPVDIGTPVAAGATLARLDRTPIELRRRQAKAVMDRASAQLTERRRRFDTQQSLFQRGNVSRQAMDSVTAELAAAESALAEAKAALDLADKDLKETEIKAPFAGTIAAREVEPFVEIETGQVVVRLDGTGGLQVTANIPASIVTDIAAGAAVQVAIDSVPGRFAGRLNRIGSRGETGLTFPVTVDLDPAVHAAGVRPGMVAEVALPIAAAAPGVYLPIGAVVPETAPGTARVFVVEEGSRVRRRAVTLGALSGDRVRITGGLGVGDEVVAVAASFLVDGQAVTPLQAR